MPDMQGKTVVVTGGNSGIGFETAVALASMGARVLITARNADKGRAAVAAITQRVAGRGPGPAGRLRSGGPGLRAPGRSGNPRAGAATRRPRQQRGPGADREGGDGRRLRGHVRHQPPRTVPAHQPAARPDDGVGAVAHRERGVDGPQCGPQGNALRRPPDHPRLPGHAGLRTIEAGQHPLHPGAVPALRRQGAHGELAASGHGADGLRGRRGYAWLPGLRDQDRQSLLPVAGQGRPHLGVPGILARGGGRHGAVLRQVQAEEAPPVGPGSPRRRGTCGR